MSLPNLTDAELGAIMHEVAALGGDMGEIARDLIGLAESVGIELPNPETSWEREALIESARRKVNGHGEAWRGE